MKVQSFLLMFLSMFVGVLIFIDWKINHHLDIRLIGIIAVVLALHVANMRMARSE